MSNAALKRWIISLLLVGAFVLLVSRMDWWQAGLSLLFPGETQVLHPRASLLVLVGEHLRLVGISSAFTILVGVTLGVLVTQPAGKDFQPLVSDFTSLGQTFPPAAVLALAVPALGFGLIPTVVALFLYGLLPIVQNTVAGISAVPVPVLDASSGMGMSRAQSLVRVEAPLAAPVILAGIRTSVIINIGTAMVGAVIGAGGLGSPIIAGLVQNNLAFIIEGAAPAAMLAVLADQLIGNIEKGFEYPGGGKGG